SAKINRFMPSNVSSTITMALKAPAPMAWERCSLVIPDMYVNQQEVQQESTKANIFAVAPTHFSTPSPANGDTLSLWERVDLMPRKRRPEPPFYSIDI